jgi:hypothetical protein
MNIISGSKYAVEGKFASAALLIGAFKNLTPNAYSVTKNIQSMPLPI